MNPEGTAKSVPPGEEKPEGVDKFHQSLNDEVGKGEGPAGG